MPRPYIEEPSYDDDGRLKSRGVIECSCGHHVELGDAMTNECDRCGQLYNGSAQSLRPRHQWEENESEDY